MCVKQLKAEAASLRKALETLIAESYGALGWLQGVVHFSDTARLYKVQKLAQAIEEAKAALAADAGRAIDRKEAEAAALREALEELLREGEDHDSVSQYSLTFDRAYAALAADAGRAMLERVRMLEEELELATRIVRPLEQLHPLDDK